MMSIASDGVKRKKEEQDELLVLLDDLIYALNRLPEQYKVNNYSQLLYQMEQVRALPWLPSPFSVPALWWSFPSFIDKFYDLYRSNVLRTINDAASTCPSYAPRRLKCSSHTRWMILCSLLLSLLSSQPL